MKLSGTRAFVAIVQNVKVGLSPAFGSPTTPTIQSSQDSPAYVCLSVSVCVSIYMCVCVWNRGQKWDSHACQMALSTALLAIV